MDIECKKLNIMKPNKRNKIARATMYRNEYNREAKGMRDWYWNDGITFYPIYRAGRKNPHKQIMRYQARMYRTWKHNRRTQWKAKLACAGHGLEIRWYRNV
jgi:hypothetical protein